MTSARAYVRRQLFRSRFPRASRDRNNRLSPRCVDAMREQLQCRDRIVNQQQTIFHAFKISVAVDVILARNRCNRASLKRVADKAMRIGKLTIKTGAGVVLLRERKEDLARAYRTR